MQRRMAQMSIEVLNWYKKLIQKESMKERIKKGGGVCMATRKQTESKQLTPLYKKLHKM